METTGLCVYGLTPENSARRRPPVSRSRAYDPTGKSSAAWEDHFPSLRRSSALPFRTSVRSFFYVRRFIVVVNRVVLFFLFFNHSSSVGTIFSTVYFYASVFSATCVRVCVCVRVWCVCVYVVCNNILHDSLNTVYCLPGRLCRNYTPPDVERSAVKHIKYYYYYFILNKRLLSLKRIERTRQKVCLYKQSLNNA